MTLSVCMPNYNHARFLRTSLDAILNQSRLPDEIIVIDDASTDESAEILSDYARRFPLIRLIVNEQNRGCVANLNALLAMARGRYFYAPAADDMILPGFFEKSINALERFPAAALCSTACMIMDEAGEHVGKLSENQLWRQTEAHFITPVATRVALHQTGSWMQGNTVVFQREALIQAGGYYSELGPYSDGFIHEVLALRHGACFVPETLAAWRRIPHTYSAKTGSNPIAVREIRDNAIAYMVGKHKNIFKTSYVSRWKNRWDACFVRTFTRAKNQEMLDALEAVLLPGNPLRALLMILFRAMSTAALILASVAAVSLRWFDLPRIISRQVRR